MLASARLLNSYLDPGDLSADQIAHTLTFLGFPIDSRENLPSGDTRLEVELTSNRGDCLSHIGLARELAAKTGRTLKLPATPAPRTQGHVSDFLSLTNEVPESCPRFTAQVVRNVRIAPSPKWLTDALEALGQRPINNVVDATNFLNFECGQPCHAFDLAKLSEGGTGKPSSACPCLVIRSAHEGEPLTTLDGKKRTLKSGEIVVGDATRAQSLAGVIGGQLSEVSPTTTDLVLEVATWDPQAVRRAARRHQVRTDASHRFERTVDPRTLDAPAQRLLALIVELTGGTPAAGILDSFPSPPPPPTPIPLRPDRVRTILGIDLSPEETTRLLRALHISVTPAAPGTQHAALLCSPPPYRPDLTREIDLIEELARLRGLDTIPTHDRVTVSIRPPQPHEEAAKALGETLPSLGFYETVTFSFLPDAAATPFLAPDLGLLHLADARHQHESALRPSLLPSLLLCRRKNQDGHVTAPGGLRLFETASTYAEETDGSVGQASRLPSLPLERRTLALLMDVPNVTKGKPGTLEERQHALRILRGALESVARALGGARTQLDLRPSAPNVSAFDPASHADVLLNGRHIGRAGLISPATQKAFGLDLPLAAVEVELEPLLVLYPPQNKVDPLPTFPGIERDLSLILADSTPWSAVCSLVHSASLALLDSVDFIGTYRGKQIGDGKKSLTLRLTFRDPARTLRHDEVDPQIATVVSLATKTLGATLRA